MANHQDASHTVISVDEKTTTDSTRSSSEESLSSYSSEASTDGLVMLGLKRVNNLTLTDGFSMPVVLMIIVYIGLSFSEMLMVKRRPVYTIVLFIPVIYNAIITIVCCVCILAAGSASRKGFFRYFMSVGHLSDVILILASTAMEIGAIYAKHYFAIISSCMLVLRIYTGVRVLHQVNHRLIQKENQAIRAKKFQITDLILEYGEITRVREELMEKLGQSEVACQAARLEMNRFSWATLVASTKTNCSKLPKDLSTDQLESTPTSKASTIYNFSTACLNTASLVDYSPLNRAQILSSAPLPLNDDPCNSNAVFSTRSSLLSNFQVAPFVKASLFSNASPSSGTTSLSSSSLASSSIDTTCSKQVSLLTKSNTSSSHVSESTPGLTLGNSEHASITYTTSASQGICSRSSQLLSTSYTSTGSSEQTSSNETSLCTSSSELDSSPQTSIRTTKSSLGIGSDSELASTSFESDSSKGTITSNLSSSSDHSTSSE